MRLGVLARRTARAIYEIASRMTAAPDTPSGHARRPQATPIVHKLAGTRPPVGDCEHMLLCECEWDID